MPKNQHSPKKLLNLEYWINGELSKSAKIWLSKSIFYVKNYPNLSQFFFHSRISIWGHIFCYWHFWITSIFKSLHFLKWCPIFDISQSTQFLKFNNFQVESQVFYIEISHRATSLQWLFTNLWMLSYSSLILTLSVTESKVNNLGNLLTIGMILVLEM